MTLRLVPVAITPVSLTDLLNTLLHQKGALNKFRNQLSNYFLSQQTYTFTSLMRATYACLLAIKTSDNTRDEIIIPRYSCPSFLHGITAAGLKIKYCDIDPTTLNINLNSLKKNLSSKTLAVMVTNLFGLSNPIDDIQKICVKNKCYVIETADYALGSVYKDKKVGSYGDFTILNFQEGKALPVGGAAVVEKKTKLMAQYDDQHRTQNTLRPILTLLAFSLFSRPFFYGCLISLLNLVKINRKKLSMEDTIRNTQHESDYKLATPTLFAITNFQAALGTVLLKKMPRHQAIRQTNSHKLSKILSQKNKKYQQIKPLSKLGQIHYIRYPILSSKPQTLCQRLAKQGIEASRMYIEHGMNINKKIYPGAFQVAHSLVTLPCHPYLTNSDLIKIQKCI